MIPIELSEDADADLDSILEYGAENFGVEIAEAYLRHLDYAIRRLSDFPELGVVRSDLVRQPRCLSFREYHIFYRFDGESLRVSRILHKARDPARWLS